jgi:hypothetical protein
VTTPTPSPGFCRRPLFVVWDNGGVRIEREYELEALKVAGRVPIGLVFTVKPFVAGTINRTIPGGDGWAIKTSDGCLSAQFDTN